MKYTIQAILEEHPCDYYTEGLVHELWDGREALSVHEIAELNIPIDDRVWILSRLLYRLSTYRARRVARRIALDVAHLWDCPDIVWWYLVTGDEESWSASWYAASSVARYANDVARDASAAARDASAAARSAAMEAAWYAAGATSRASAAAAAESAARGTTDAIGAAVAASWAIAGATGAVGSAAFGAREAAMENYLQIIVNAFGKE